MKWFHVQFFMLEKQEWAHPFVSRCEGVVSSEIEEFSVDDIRRVADYAWRFALIECREVTDPGRLEKTMDYLRSRLGRFSDEKEARFSIDRFPIGGRNAVFDSKGDHTVKITFDILPVGADPLAIEISPS